MALVLFPRFFFFFNDPPPTEIYTLSLHDALPISDPGVDAVGDHDQVGVRKLVEVLDLDEFADRKSTRLNSSHTVISYAVFCLKKKKHKHINRTFLNEIARLGCRQLFTVLMRARQR